MHIKKKKNSFLCLKITFPLESSSRKSLLVQYSSQLSWIILNHEGIMHMERSLEQSQHMTDLHNTACVCTQMTLAQKQRWKKHNT